LKLYGLTLPDLGEGVAEGEVIEWLVEAGDRIATDQPIVEVSTDKADVVIPSPVDGVVEIIYVEPGEPVPVGTVLAEIATDQPIDDPSASHTPEDRDHPRPGPPPSHSGTAALPDVRMLARDLGVDLDAIQPRNRSGRVTTEDVRAAAADTEPAGHGRPGPAARQTIARRLSDAARVPTVTNVDEADFEAVRAAQVPPLIAFARAVVLALADHPKLNSWWRERDGTLIEHHEVHLGVATQTARGLLVPVVRDAHELTTAELSTAIREATTAARQAKVRPELLRGSTITITSAGRGSGTFATPLLNLPEIGIVGLYRVAKRPVVRDAEVIPRHTANLSISFDHRAIDGADAAAFLSRTIEIIERWPRELPEAEPPQDQRADVG